MSWANNKQHVQVQCPDQVVQMGVYQDEAGACSPVTYINGISVTTIAQDALGTLLTKQPRLDVVKCEFRLQKGIFLQKYHG